MAKGTEVNELPISVAYGVASAQCWLRLTVVEGTTVEQAIAHSGVVERFPEIDLTNQKVGIFGKPVKLDRPVEAGDRVEIYRPITADPEVAEYRD